jgi:hypothetical protein
MENTEKELNLEQKVTVRSIAPWTTGFQRIETIGDVTIPANGSVRLSRSEIIAQVQNGNVLFTGVDSRGSHATLYIEDEPTRIEVDFDIKEEKITQKVITVDAVKKLFEYKTMKTFEEKLKELVLTRAEKHAIANIVRKEKINDHEKVRVVENYIGVSI